MFIIVLFSVFQAEVGVKVIYRGVCQQRKEGGSAGHRVTPDQMDGRKCKSE
jgi:hypothetical protein